jgi:hypothetical protein
MFSETGDARDRLDHLLDRAPLLMFPLQRRCETTSRLPSADLRRRYDHGRLDGRARLPDPLDLEPARRVIRAALKV